MRKLSLTCYMAMLLVSSAFANDWNGKKAAISFSYDDSLNVHLDIVSPKLESADFRGTFYITAHAEPFRTRLNDFRALAEKHHELGNHTLFHPCNGTGADRAWVSANGDLSKWNVEKMLAHTEMANTTLEALDGEKVRTFAYPCGDTKAGKESYIAEIAPLFSAARAVGGAPPQIDQVDLRAVPSFVVNGHSFTEMKLLVDEAIRSGTWLVFLFHGVGGEHSLNISEDTHSTLIDYVKKRQADIWVAPLRDISIFVDEYQKNATLNDTSLKQ